MMKSTENEIEKDINDVFDELLLCEEKLVADGYSEGYTNGAREDNFEGYHLGYHRGAELGSELGYYSGIIHTHLTKHEQDNSYSDKVMKHINLLKKYIDEFPITNSEDVDIIKQADNIRTIFKKVCALLKLDASYPEIDNLTF